MIASSIIVLPLGTNSIAHTLGLIVFRLTEIILATFYFIKSLICIKSVKSHYVSIRAYCVTLMKSWQKYCQRGAHPACSSKALT